MNKRLILFSVLIIFLVGMTIGCIAAETFEIKPEQDKYLSKESGENKVEVYAWQSSSYKEVNIFAYKNVKTVNKKDYATSIFYEDNEN